MKKLILTIIHISPIIFISTGHSANTKSAPIPIKAFNCEQKASLSPEVQASFLYNAIVSGNEEKALRCLNKYGNVTEYRSPQTQRSPLHEILRRSPDNFYTLRRILLDPNTRIDDPDENGDSPLVWAAKQGESIFIRLLLNHGADIHFQNKKNRTALHYFAQRGECIKIIKKVLKRGANPNIQDIEGKTPLHYAAIAGRPDVIQILLQHNANPWIIDKDGKTPYDVATNNNSQIVLHHAMAKKPKYPEETESISIFYVEID